ncbi:hypothetical protein VTO42DRAFT_7617 [Malbranchea cinnamomea]
MISLSPLLLCLGLLSLPLPSLEVGFGPVPATARKGKAQPSPAKPSQPLGSHQLERLGGGGEQSDDGDGTTLFRDHPPYESRMGRTPLSFYRPTKMRLLAALILRHSLSISGLAARVSAASGGQGRSHRSSPSPVRIGTSGAYLLVAPCQVAKTAHRPF